MKDQLVLNIYEKNVEIDMRSYSLLKRLKVSIAFLLYGSVTMSGKSLNQININK